MAVEKNYDKIVSILLTKDNIDINKPYILKYILLI